MSDFVTVEVCRGKCPCPGTPHQVERVDIIAALDLPTGAAATASLRPLIDAGDDDPGSIEAALIRGYLPAAIRRWTFLEPDGTGGIRPVPITRANLDRLIPWDQGGDELVDRCDGLYSERLLAPLLARTSMPSLHGATPDSTSVIPQSGSQPPEPSPRSLPIDLDGVPSGVPVP